MTFIEWKKSYAVGNPLVDYDHMTLVSITNELFHRVEQGYSAEEIAKTISQLTDYVERHFAREEDLFKGTEYPDIDKHVAMHADITKTVRDIATAYTANPSAINVFEVLDFLKTWLTHHIMKADRGYGPYLKG
ncbi:MAG: hemerythrin family protein [Alphaproteobacteria bacterium]|nr:hemerythrin family protein [Alphaproteobacteria bacterium]